MRDSTSNLFTGVISSADTGVYSVQVDSLDGDTKSLLQAIPLVGVFATALGFKDCPVLSPGSTVLCYILTSDICIILGVIPDHDVANFRFYNRGFLKTFDGKFDKKNSMGYNSESTKKITSNQNRPSDVESGEHVTANEFGVMFGALQELAFLKGSELSQVQCFLLDDLVRIISHNYEHFSALGEFKIFHDGKTIQAEFGSTHLSRESLGIPQRTENKRPVFADDPAELDIKDAHDYYKFVVDERTKAIERFKTFLGRISDFLHMFLVAPDPSAVRNLNGDLNGGFDTGLVDWFVGTDGRVSLRSATSLTIEKSNWIMVPHRVRVAEDPLGDDGTELEYPVKDPFEFDNTYNYRMNPQAYALQIRDCNSYLQDLLAYKNFFLHEKDFRLSKDPSSETPLAAVEDIDPKQKYPMSDYILRRSGIYLMNNGGVMIKDAWGSAIVMEGGNISLQPAKDLIEQPLRHHVIKAGQNIAWSSKKDIDLSSTEKGFRLKTRGVQHLYSHEQGIILQSESKNAAPPLPADESYQFFGGILLKSKTGIYSYADRIFDRAESNALYKSDYLTVEASGAGMLLKSAKDIAAIADADIRLLTKNNIEIIGEKSVMLAGKDTLIGKKDEPVLLVPAPNSLPCLMNGVLDLDKDFNTMIETYQQIDMQKAMAPFDKDTTFTDMKFRFLKSDYYHLLDSKQDFIQMSISQQDDESFGFLNLKVWAEESVNDTLPFPGAAKFPEYYVSSTLSNQQVLYNDIYSKPSNSLIKNPNALGSVSLNKYKVLE